MCLTLEDDVEAGEPRVERTVPRTVQDLLPDGPASSRSSTALHGTVVTVLVEIHRVDGLWVRR